MSDQQQTIELMPNQQHEMLASQNQQRGMDISNARGWALVAKHESHIAALDQALKAHVVANQKLREEKEVLQQHLAEEKARVIALTDENDELRSGRGLPQRRKRAKKSAKPAQK